MFSTCPSSYCVDINSVSFSTPGAGDSKLNKNVALLATFPDLEANTIAVIPNFSNCYRTRHGSQVPVITVKNTLANVFVIGPEVL